MSDDRKLTTFTNHSAKRLWGEEECRLLINAALLKLIDDAGGTIVISVEDLLRVANNGKGALAMAMSDDDKILTLTRIKETS